MAIRLLSPQVSIFQNYIGSKNFETIRQKQYEKHACTASMTSIIQQQTFKMVPSSAVLES